MGQEEDFFVKNAPRWSDFAAGRTDVAAEAITRARVDAIAATYVFALVKKQAVHAFLQDGLTIRDMAERTGLARSEVGRIARRLAKEAEGSPVETAPALSHAQIPDLVRAAWGAPQPPN